MKTIPFVETVTLVDRAGKPILQDEKPVTLSDLDFLLERTYENGICGTRTGYEQIVFTEAMRASIKAQAPTAQQEGWKLEDAHFEAFKTHLSGAQLTQALVHNMAPFVKRFFE